MKSETIQSVWGAHILDDPLLILLAFKVFNILYIHVLATNNLSK